MFGLYDHGKIFAIRDNSRHSPVSVEEHLVIPSYGIAGHAN